MADFQYILFDPEVMCGGRRYLGIDVSPTLQAARYLRIAAPTLTPQGARYFPWTITVVPRYPKPVYGRDFQRLSSVKSTV